MSELSFGGQQNEVKSGKTVNEAGSGLDLLHYYRLILRNLWKIILFSVVVGLLSALYALSLNPVYYSETTMLIEDQQPNVVSFQDVYQVDSRGRQYVGTQLEILRSRSLAERVVDRMGLTTHPLYDPRQQSDSGKSFSIDSFMSLLGLANEEVEGDEDVIDGEELEAFIRKRVVDQILLSINISPIRNTQLVRVFVKAGDAQLTADIANAFTDTYIESHLEAKLEVTQKATMWLSGRLDDLRVNLRSSEQKLQEYREKEQLIDADGVRSIDVAELQQLTTNLVEVRSQRTDAETLFRQLSSGSSSIDRLLALPAISSNVLVQGLITSRADAKRRMAELGKRYGAKHPQMLAALSDVKQIEQELESQVKNVADGIESTYLAAKGAERSLRNQIANVKSRLQTVGRKEFPLRELEREVEANRQLYDVFLNRGKEADEVGTLESVNARVIDAAIPAEYPSEPQKKSIVFMAVLLSGMFAAGVILLLDFLDNTIKSPDDVEERLRVPLLGHLPLDKKSKTEAPFMGFLSDEKGQFAEAVRTIRTSFILSGLDRPAKVTLITSSVPNEGKSTVSLCTAQALGQMEKVLLIDADMRRPSIAKALDISLLTPGLSNLIAGTAEPSECITQLPNSEVSVITGGVVLGNPLDLLASDKFVQVLDKLKENYDRIIIDSAPIQAVSDSLVIATHADALIYVVKSDATSIPVIKKGLRRLSEANAKFSGVVLNQVDVDKMKKVAGYDAGYYENYGYAAVPSSKKA